MYRLNPVGSLGDYSNIIRLCEKLLSENIKNPSPPLLTFLLFIYEQKMEIGGACPVKPYERYMEVREFTRNDNYEFNYLLPTFLLPIFECVYQRSYQVFTWFGLFCGSRSVICWSVWIKFVLPIGSTGEGNFNPSMDQRPVVPRARSHKSPYYKV